MREKKCEGHMAKDVQGERKDWKCEEDVDYFSRKLSEC